MQWNEFSWETQRKVLAQLEENLLKETDIEMQDAMVAAIQELEMWSNTPCEIVGSDDNVFVAQASDGE